MDWFAWHDGYDGPRAARLRIVRDQLEAAVVEVSSSPVRIVSICAGQGHDVIGVLARLGGRIEASALLVELDPRNVEVARRRASEAGVESLNVVAGDAGTTDAYARAVPSDVVLTCGVYGSLTDEDVDRTVAALPTLLAPGGQVVWTAHRAAPGLWKRVRDGLVRHGFEQAWTSPDDEPHGVGRHRLVADPRPFEPGRRMFDFADEATLVALGRTRT